MLIHRNDVSLKDLVHINKLLHILSENARDLSVLKLENCLKQKNFEMVSARDERPSLPTEEESMVNMPMHAMATVHFSKALGNCFAYIDDVVKDPAIQFKGLGTKITQELILMARERGAKWVALTSAPKRVAANIIYSRLMRCVSEARVLF
jgi:GNAT superfamily N-acetyltransferase